MSDSIRVCIGDDHRVVREGLKLVLCDPVNGLPEIRVVAEAADGPQVLERVTGLHGPAGLDMVLLDIALPELDGLEVLQQLRRDWPTLPVLMLSTYPERQYAVRCLQMGAAGYLHKSADPDAMVAAVRRVAAGQRYVSDATAQALAQAVARTSPVRGLAERKSHGLEALSYREHQVFRLLMTGQTVSEIGAQLGLAPNTVSTYRARILEKTGARNDVELALLARGPATD
ncbi:response regulator transcription factor [Acidovorax lacteus]|uniref:Response regulator transcription factor RqpR n=1 Tax=Acidovorax lacteus TaxID=1924988 RepID=A0ABP8L9Q0_9BURK